MGSKSRMDPRPLEGSHFLKPLLLLFLRSSPLLLSLKVGFYSWKSKIKIFSYIRVLILRSLWSSLFKAKQPFSNKNTSSISLPLSIDWFLTSSYLFNSFSKKASSNIICIWIVCRATLFILFRFSTIFSLILLSWSFWIWSSKKKF